MEGLYPRPGRQIRVGVIGCGEVAQIIHLPTLAQLAGHYEVTALCDISREVLHGVGDAWGVERRVEDHRALAELPEIDAVLIANPDPWHADAALAAIAAGKDVLVEKPMCLGPRECDEIVAAAERAGAIVQVGYMRRHAPALAEAKRMLSELGEIRLARVHDLIGFNHIIIQGTSRVIRGDDVPAAASEEMWARRAALVEEALGPLPTELRRARGLRLVVPIWTMGSIEPEPLAALLDAAAGGTGVAGFHGGMGDAF